MPRQHFSFKTTDAISLDTKAFNVGDWWDAKAPMAARPWMDDAPPDQSFGRLKAMEQRADAMEALTFPAPGPKRDLPPDDRGSDWWGQKQTKLQDQANFKAAFAVPEGPAMASQQSQSAPYTMTLNGTDYRLTLNDNFDTFEARQGHGDDGIWTTSFSPHLDDLRTIAANGEGQYYVDPDMTYLPNPFSVDDGVLSIAAHELDAAQQAQAGGMEYASGMMSTELSFGMDGGYIEISAQVPDQQGFLSAFWLLPTDGDWSAEIDVFETLGHLPETMNTNIWDNGTPNQLSFPTIDMSDGFHTYGLEWTDTDITWYIDGQSVRTTANTVGEDMYLVASLAVDTNWTGAVDGTTDFTDSFDIDYIRVYEPDVASSNAGGVGDDIVADIPTYGANPWDEALYGTRWTDTIDGAGGNDTIYGRDGGDVLSGGDGQDRLFGQNDDDLIFGGADRDTLNGGDGEDVITGGAGVDHMWGGTWAGDGESDIFAFTPGDGKDYVHAFEDGLDRVDVSSYGLSWGNLAGHIQDHGWASYVDLASAGGAAGDGVYLIGIDAVQLTADDFILTAAA